MHVKKKAQHPTSAASSRTVKTRCSEIQTARSIVSGGEPSALMEVLPLSDEVSIAEGRHHEHCNWLSSNIGYKSQPGYYLEQNEIKHYTKQFLNVTCPGGSKHQEFL